MYFGHVLTLISEPLCPDGWVGLPGNGNCYYFPDGKRNREDGKTLCQTEQAHADLIMVNDADEQSFLSCEQFFLPNHSSLTSIFNVL